MICSLTTKQPIIKFLTRDGFPFLLEWGKGNKDKVKKERANF